MAAPGKKENGPSVKRVELPDGKTMEIVYFDEASVVEENRQVAQPTRELHLCPSCSSGLVYPVEWAEATSMEWEVVLRCPNCERRETGIFDQTTVEHFDEELDRGTDELVDDLRRLVYANMEEEIDRFAQALAEDYVLPEDF